MYIFKNQNLKNESLKINFKQIKKFLKKVFDKVNLKLPLRVLYFGYNFQLK